MFKLFNIFKYNEPLEKVAAEELYEAERALLQAQTTLEYAQSLVTYNKNRIERLQPIVKAANDAQVVLVKEQYPHPPPFRRSEPRNNYKSEPQVIDTA